MKIKALHQNMFLMFLSFRRTLSAGTAQLNFPGRDRKNWIFGCDLSNEAAQQIAHEINNAVQQLQLPHEKSPSANVVTVSVGYIQTQCNSIESFAHLILKADEALYKAKNNGRNQNIEYSSITHIHI